MPAAAQRSASAPQIRSVSGQRSRTQLFDGAKKLLQQLAPRSQEWKAPAGPETRLRDALRQLRLKIETMTERLNDPAFVVTIDWVVAYARAHRTYMETVCLGTFDKKEFPLTTDLFRHVLQHPTVEKVLDGGKVPLEAPAEGELRSLTAAEFLPRVSQAVEALDVEMEKTSKPACSAEALRHTAACIEPSPESGIAVLAPPAPPRSPEEDDKEAWGRVAWLPSQARKPAKAEQPSELACVGALPTPSRSQASHSDLRSSQGRDPTQRRPKGNRADDRPRPRGARIVRASSTGMVVRRPQADEVQEAEGELAQKMRRFSGGASWSGLSPRSQRLAARSERAGEGTLEDEQDNLAVAEKRRLLQKRLISCGFQTTSCQ